MVSMIAVFEDGAMQKAGVIGYARGCTTVLDRPGLEAASCGCYRAVRRQVERLLGAFLGGLREIRRRPDSTAETASPYGNG